MSGAVRVYKVGGRALEDPAVVGSLADEIRRVGGHVLLVQGGGRHVDRMLGALSLESRFVNGRRETSPAAMEVVEMVLSGIVNKSLAAGLTAAGVPAVGISGRDGDLIRARLEPGLGRVGVPQSVKTGLVRALWEAGFVPVVSPVSNGPEEESVNVNADEVAKALALDLGARTLVYLSDVDGVLVEDEALSSLTADRAQTLMENGTIKGGMAMKVRVAIETARSGIPEVLIAGKKRLFGGFAGTRILAEAYDRARA